MTNDTFNRTTTKTMLRSVRFTSPHKSSAYSAGSNTPLKKVQYSIRQNFIDEILADSSVPKTNFVHSEGSAFVPILPHPTTNDTINPPTTKTMSRCTSKREASWNQRIRELKEYRKEFGDCLVPRNYKENKALGRWVNTQRDQYQLKQQGKHSQITDDRIEELEKIGFVWKVKADNQDVWNQRIRELKEYRKEFGDCLVPYTYKDNKALGIWVSTQRQQYKLKQQGKYSKITDDRIDELEKIGFVWKVKADNCKKSKRSGSSTRPSSKSARISKSKIAIMTQKQAGGLEGVWV